MTVRRLQLGVVAVLLLVAVSVALGLRWYATASRDPAFFEEAIQAFETTDRASPPAPGKVVFVGSSSFRFWKSLAEDMAPLEVLGRGFGGAHMRHLVYNARRIVTPYRPSAVVVYAGDNDLSEGTGKTPETVIADYRELVGLVRADLGSVPIFFVAIKPSRLRWERWPEMSRANEMIRELSSGDASLTFIDIAPAMLGPDGTPRDDLFRFDGLHLSDEGYRAWTAVIKPQLLATLATPGS